MLLMLLLRQNRSDPQMTLQLLIEYPADADASATQTDSAHHTPRARITRFRVIEHEEKMKDAAATRSRLGSCSSLSILIARVLLAHVFAFYCFHTFAHFSSARALFSLSSLLWTHLPCLLAMLLAWRVVGMRSSRGIDALQRLREESILVIPGVGVQLESGTAVFDPTAEDAAAARNGSDASRSLSPGSSHSVCSPSSSSYPSVRRRARLFLDASRIAHVLINEGVHRSTFVYYLVIVLKGATAAATKGHSAANRSGSNAADSAASSSSCAVAGLASPSDLIHADQTLVLPFEQLQPRYNILLPIYEGMQTCSTGTPS